MQVKYEKRDIRSKSLLVAGSLSPAVQGYIYDSDMPKPCRWFVGREKELEQLHGLLIDHSKVFVHGIPGIGKSELAKAYVSRYGREYTNVLYLYYDGDLKRIIADIDFADDRPGESQEARFQRHDRFLRTLRDDTLLVVDNFNVTASEDSFLDVMLRYRCRILFTTRCRYEEQTSLEIQELHLDTLVELMGKFYDTDRKLDVMKEIIALLHGHTFAVELAARLLANSMLRPKALLKKLKKEKAAMDAEDRIRSVKDGTSRKTTYYDHIHTLFSLYRLSRPEQQMMRCLIFVPEKGVPVQQFGVWMNLRNLNRINDLIEMGFVQPDDGRYVSLHPMIREVALEEMAPSVQNCAVLLDSLQRISLMHGMEFQGYKLKEKTIDDLRSKEERCERELDAALTEFQTLSRKTEAHDPNALWAERLRLRETMSQETEDQLKSHFGNSFSHRRLQNAESDVRLDLERDEINLRQYLAWLQQRDRESMHRQQKVNNLKSVCER